MMMEIIVPETASKDGNIMAGKSPHEFYYRLRQYEWYKTHGHKSEDCKNISPTDREWEAQFMRNFERKWKWLRRKQ